MKNFDQGHLQAMRQLPRFPDENVQQPCPACGKVTLRHYMYLVEGRSIPTAITITWCGSCRRYHDSMVILREGLTFTDPLGHLSRTERRCMGTGEILELLDRMWSSGRAPQTFVIPPGPPRYPTRPPKGAGEEEPGRRRRDAPVRRRKNR